MSIIECDHRQANRRTTIGGGIARPQECVQWRGRIRERRADPFYRELKKMKLGNQHSRWFKPCRTSSTVNSGWGIQPRFALPADSSADAQLSVNFVQ